MRTGADYRESLRDGRDVWVVGEGAVADVTTHPSTAAMVDEYVAWYDRHFDPEWQDILLTPSDGNGHRHPLALTPPTTSADLRRLGKAISAVHFITGGNMTHTPGYGALIALGMLNSLKRVNHSSEDIEAAEAYLESLRESGRFLTFAGGGPLIGTRLRQDESERAALRLVSDTEEGIVVTGKIQMHTSTPFAEDLLITSRDEMPPGSGRHLWFIVPVNAPGLRVVSRRAVAKHPNRFLSPLSSRFDELDSMVWMEDVFVPRSRVFTGETLDRNRRHSLVCWLLWHHSYGWLAKSELTLGLALALAEVMGLKSNPQTIEQLAELTVNVQTTRTCMTAAELDPETTVSGHALPNQIHVASAGINTLRVRQRMAEILRGLPGSSLVNAPADTDFADPEMAAGLEDAFGGGGYSALQRAALLQLAWDQVSSGLDGREAVFELHASGGLEAWRAQVAAWFGSYNELANGVQEFMQVDLPPLDLSSLQEVAPPPRRMPLSRPGS